jgi:PAS domain S-box-containing protein
MTLLQNNTDQPNQILIVDDERQDRELLEVMLAPSGFVLRTAASGREALTMVAQRPPDLILLDIVMPGLDGFEVMAEIKNNPATENIIVIMITSLDDRTTRMRGLNAGVEDFLTKPVDRAELTARVRNLLRLKAYGDYYGQYSELLETKVASRTADLLKRSKLLEEQAVLLTEQAGLLDLVHDAIVVRDMDGRILFWSRGAEVMYRCQKKDALGKNISELLKTGFFEPIEQIQATLLRESHWEGETIHHRTDGTSLTVASRWALQRDKTGAPLQVLAINTDISDRKKQEETAVV